MRRVQQRFEVRDAAVIVVNAEEIGNVVTVVFVRRGIHRQEPDAIDAKPLDVFEFLGHAPEVADPVVVGIKERLDRCFVKHRVLEPERIATHHASTDADLSVGPITSSIARIILTWGTHDDEAAQITPARYHDDVMDYLPQSEMIAGHG